MELSVIICTYNRSRNLPWCIQCLSQQQGVEDLEWEVVIVDNNSTDDTPQSVTSLQNQFSVPIRYAFEKRQGLSYARNRGVVETSGTYFAFIDDDILVSPNWLDAIHTSFLKNDADAVGGRIHLDKSIMLPSWITPELHGFLGYHDFGEKPFQMDGITKYPYGGNMAFHRRVIDRIGFFNPNVGRKGEGKKRSELFKGEETEYCHRLAKAGGRFFYEPDAIVQHRVLPFQLRKSYFRTIHFNAGCQYGIFDSTRYRRNFFGIPLFLFPQTARAMGRYLHQLVRRGTDYAFRQEMTVCHFWGLITGYVLRHRKK